MGKTDLGKWMITNGGEYSADATYEQLTMVKYGNSTYITLKTVTGITPVDDKINYQLMAQGFDATALSAVQAEDTQGLCGEKGNIVTAQSLVDALADKVINTVMTKIGTAALTGGMTDLSSGLNALNSNLTPSGITDVSHAINTVYGSGNISYHVIGKVCFVYFVFTPSQKCDNVGLLNNGVLPLAKDSLYRSISTWGNPNVAVSLVQTVTTGGLRFWCGESSIGMQIFDSFSYCIK